MDWDLFWNAFAAIGTTIGTFISSIALLLTYRQYKLSKETKLKVKIETVKLYEDESDNYDKFLVFNFYNIGLIELSVRSISLKVFGDKYDITKNIESKRILNECKTELPVKVTNYQSASVAITYEELYSVIKYIEQFNDKNIKYLKFIIREGNGKEYIKRIRKKKLL